LFLYIIYRITFVVLCHQTFFQSAPDKGQVTLLACSPFFSLFFCSCLLLSLKMSSSFKLYKYNPWGPCAIIAMRHVSFGASGGSLLWQAIAKSTPAGRPQPNSARADLRCTTFLYTSQLPEEESLKVYFYPVRLYHWNSVLVARGQGLRSFKLEMGI
jgi:hypothetical protein